MRTSMLREALTFLLGFWALILLVAGAVASLGLVVWPWSSQPLLAATVGGIGLLASLLGALVLTRA